MHLLVLHLLVPLFPSGCRLPNAVWKDSAAGSCEAARLEVHEQLQSSELIREGVNGAMYTWGYALQEWLKKVLDLRMYPDLIRKDVHLVMYTYGWSSWNAFIRVLNPGCMRI